MIKVGLTVIPIWGAVINEALYDAPSRIHQERVEKFLGLLHERVRKIETSLNSFIIPQSEEFLDLTQKIFSKVLKTKSELKLKTFADAYFMPHKFLYKIMKKNNHE